MKTNKYIEIVDFVDEQLTREIVTIKIATELDATKQYTISISFRSTLNGDLRGFYRSSYVDNGTKKYSFLKI